MSTQNPVFQVLTPSGNQAPIAAGSRVTALQHGQIGVFNKHSGLSVDGTVAGDCKDVFIAVGINRASGAGAADDILQSAGQHIQVRNLKAYDFKGYVPEVQKVIEVTGMKAKADTAYGLKIEFRNQKAYALNGYNQFCKTFNAQTSPSLDELSTEGNNGELAELLINDINGDTDKLALASAFAYQIKTTVASAATGNGTLTITIGTEVFTVDVLNADAVATVAAKIAADINGTDASAYAASNVGADLFVFPKVAAKTGSTTATIALTSAGGTGVTINAITAANANIADTVAFRVANPNAGIGIRVTGVLQARPSFGNDINVQYYKTGTDFDVTSPYGFTVNPTITTITQVQYPEGKGYDLKQLEYVAGGWNGKPGPYRQSSLTGLPRAGFEYRIDANANYHQFVIVGEFKAQAGWEAHENSIQNIVAIPVADSTTFNGLVTILDAIFSGFQPMANDVAANDTEQLPTNQLAANTDGIEILS